ncbi:MAG TPA: hypothetical protein VGI81_17350 [Tepidisphaeraceae bacterium]|jgi:predicted ATP-grasp superfamily ATP-dependent carboligase
MFKHRQSDDGNPASAIADWPPVVVAGAYQTGVVLMRDLARRGVETYCFDCDTDNPGFRTVYGRASASPNPDENPQGWFEFMVDLSKRVGRKPVLIPSADQFVSAIAREAARLREHFIFSEEGIAAQASLATKEYQYELAPAHGLAVPRSKVARSLDEVKAFADGCTFPCIMKPLHFRHWEQLSPENPLRGKKLKVAADAEELYTAYLSCSGVTPSVVLQEEICGPDTAKLVYLSCYSITGRRLGSCIVRELRTTPIHFGSASICESTRDDESDALCDRFLSGIGYKGVCEIELKRDTRTGQVMMIEANPRYSVTADAAPYAGVPLGWLHYLDVIGKNPAPVSPRGNHFRHIVLARDCLAAPSYVSEGALSWWAIIRTYKPPVAFFDFDVRDWRVSLDTLRHVARILLGKAWRRCRRGLFARAEAGERPSGSAQLARVPKPAP